MPEPLHQGHLYRFHGKATLMPELNPPDPMEALGKVREIQPGAVAMVVSIGERGGSPWYEVSFPGTEITGWINATNLVGVRIEHMGDATEGAAET